MKINVTQQDIDRGVHGDCDRCPIARAVRRELGRREIEVDDTVRVPMDNFVMKLPLKAWNFVQRFDSYKKVKPFSFVLRGYKRIG